MPELPKPALSLRLNECTGFVMLWHFSMMKRWYIRTRDARLVLLVGCLLLAFGEITGQAGAGDRYRERVLPVLVDRCFDCHGDGESEGGLALDAFESDADLLQDTELWWKVVKNVRARIMPPRRKTPMSEQEFELVNTWVQRDVFGIEPSDPDPGRITLRRLNREEYRNTVRDLVGFDYDTELEFPPDDTGFGFDNIGDVLSVSPLLFEKFVTAAESIVDAVVPKASRVMPELRFSGSDLEASDGETSGDRISFYQGISVSRPFEIETPGEYEVRFDVRVDGEFAFDPGRLKAQFLLDDEVGAEAEFVYAFSDDPDRGASFTYRVVRQLGEGRHTLGIRTQPLVDPSEKLRRLDFRVGAVTVRGPADEAHWVPPEGYERFFPSGPAPVGAEARRAYAFEILEKFAERAFRRPVKREVVDRLAELALDHGGTFEAGIGRALVAVLSSPRFLFRFESEEPTPLAEEESQFPLVDEWALASRLSYFLWSTMPDEPLFELARQGRLRAEMGEQIDRMLRDERADAFVRNFVGQWLQTRNVDHVPIEADAAFGLEHERAALREAFGRRALWERNDDVSPELAAARKRYREIEQTIGRFNRRLRDSMRRETELFFGDLLRNNRSALELIDSDYTLLNERLAEHYGIDGVRGDTMQRVVLPEGSPRGGVLTQGSMLLVTSNPTRTSPVKRGLFILENILGTPTPPAPPNIPELEAAAESFEDHEPTLRQLLARHREDPLCRSCHARIDPLGLAFENFTAVGSWRDREEGQAIDTSGRLVTGESFDGVQELKRILATEHRASFYRCLVEKTLTYALGRGLEPLDDLFVDQMVGQLEREGGKIRALIRSVVESVPFQRTRRVDPNQSPGKVSPAQ